MTFNIYESESNYLIQSFLPGLETDSLHVYVESGALVIEAKRTTVEKNTAKRTLSKEGVQNNSAEWSRGSRCHNGGLQGRSIKSDFAKKSQKN